ncbi:MAG: hypothetical protein QF569_27860 [Candidatus Poribacteria bacterium]|jgi:hypothetical protein|nr:hypothetical protein [Candidatus Poribacteria bacterium]
MNLEIRKQQLMDQLSEAYFSAIELHAIAYLFRVDHQAKELVETTRTYTDQQGRFELLTPAGLEAQIFVDPKDAKNVPAELKGKIREEEQRKGKVL